MSHRPMLLLCVDYGSVRVCVVCVGFGLIYFNYKNAALLPAQNAFRPVNAG